MPVNRNLDMNRSYQFSFSSKMPSMYDVESRERKAKTMIAVLSDYCGGEEKLAKLAVLDVGSSTGIIDNYLSRHFMKTTGIDIDTDAVAHAAQTFDQDNLVFMEADAMNMSFQENSFDIVICSQIYEHVPDAAKLVSEIHRVLKPAGVCFFSAGNRINIMEPHYRLPFLSILPKPLAHLYMRLAGKGSHYYEEHFTYWGLKKLTQDFICHDYTVKMVNQPQNYAIEYMVPEQGLKGRIVRLIANYFIWFFPNYIWLLEKPGQVSSQ
jgi:2-polyprenyl-3-methyl-5-hydroxy-6-metoxy-1,4-benzoquinol methylase